jgi:hypothetical protein
VISMARLSAYDRPKSDIYANVRINNLTWKFGYEEKKYECLNYRVLRLLCLPVWQDSRDLSADAGYLLSKATILGGHDKRDIHQNFTLHKTKLFRQLLKRSLTPSKSEKKSVDSCKTTPF